MTLTIPVEIDTNQITADFGQSLRDRGLAEHTCRIYPSHIGRFLTWCQRTIGTLIEVPEPIFYATWINEARLQPNCGPSNIKQRLAAGRAFYVHLGREISALNAYKAPPIPEPDPSPLPGGMDDIRRMIAAAETAPEEIACALGGFAGLRVSETTSITWASINLTSRELTVTGKGDKVRKIPIGNSLYPLLVKARSMQGLPGPERRVCELSYDAARGRITRIGHDARIAVPVVRSHDLRATFATALYERTQDVLMVSKLLGHTSIATTQAYLGHDAKKTRSAVNDL